jgi:hypothetical protein
MSKQHAQRPMQHRHGHAEGHQEQPGAAEVAQADARTPQVSIGKPFPVRLAGAIIHEKWFV